MEKKIPSGVKRWLIERTGSTYYKVTRVLEGISADAKLIEQVKDLLAEYNKMQEDLNKEIENL